MSFFKGLTGGGSVTTPATGIYSLPANAQGALNTLVDRAQGYIDNPDIFAPSGFNADQNSAFNLARRGANRTAGDVSSMIQPYMNPYDKFVIDEVNRQYQAPYSALNSLMAEQGQFGSNRGMLGANDIDLSRTNQIGALRQQNYAGALNTALGQEQNAIGNLLTTGGLQQDQATAEKQAPISALDFLGKVMSSYYPTNMLLQTGSQQAQKVKSGGGLSGILGALKTGASFFSGVSGLGAGAGLWGGYDPSTGITWDSGRY
jgi:hypothetical protein